MFIQSEVMSQSSQLLSSKTPDGACPPRTPEPLPSSLFPLSSALPPSRQAAGSLKPRHRRRNVVLVREYNASRSHKFGPGRSRHFTSPPHIAKQSINNFSYPARSTLSATATSLVHSPSRPLPRLFRHHPRWWACRSQTALSIIASSLGILALLSAMAVATSQSTPHSANLRSTRH